MPSRNLPETHPDEPQGIISQFAKRQIESRLKWPCRFKGRDWCESGITEEHFKFPPEEFSKYRYCPVFCELKKELSENKVSHTSRTPPKFLPLRCEHGIPICTPTKPGIGILMGHFLKFNTWCQDECWICRDKKPREISPLVKRKYQRKQLKKPHEKGSLNKAQKELVWKKNLHWTLVKNKKEFVWKEVLGKIYRPLPEFSQRKTAYEFEREDKLIRSISKRLGFENLLPAIEAGYRHEEMNLALKPNNPWEGQVKSKFVGVLFDGFTHPHSENPDDEDTSDLTEFDRRVYKYSNASNVLSETRKPILKDGKLLRGKYYKEVPTETRLTKSQIIVLEHLANGLNQIEIAEKMNCSQPAVSQFRKAGIENLRKYIKTPPYKKICYRQLSEEQFQLILDSFPPDRINVGWKSIRQKEFKGNNDEFVFFNRDEAYFTNLMSMIDMLPKFNVERCYGVVGMGMKTVWVSFGGKHWKANVSWRLPHLKTIIKKQPYEAILKRLYKTQDEWRKLSEKCDKISMLP